jgi:tetratricopeptide (TPR) repeat protein
MEIILALALSVAATATPAEQAEQLARRAVAEAATHNERCVADAAKALSLTSDFEPTAYVKAGRKGEVVEDAYLAARGEFRRHRAGLYEAMGACLAASGRHAPAVRYLRRAFYLDPEAGRALRLAQSLVGLGRGREAVDVLLEGRGAAGIPPEGMALASQAADVAGLPSLQAEIDRVRIAALPVEPKPEIRDGPLVLPDRAGLSTGQALEFTDDALWLLYVPQPDCRTCSADLETLKRVEPVGSHVVLVPPGPDQDEALRGVVNLYRYKWPYASGARVASTLDAHPPSVVLVARHGFVTVVVRSPFSATLPSIVQALSRHDVTETVPRAQWNRRRVERHPPAPKPELAAGGLAPGEDEPAPSEFGAAVAAYQAGRPAEALRLFEALEARGDGWLLPPEARFDRALCLAALGRREEARRLLLRTGDSRFQDELDRALEDVGSRKGP